MKLSELGLKTKPATKYFDGGWIAFSTENQNLFFEIFAVSKTNMGSIAKNWVTSKDQFDALMSIKTIKQVTEVLAQ